MLINKSTHFSAKAAKNAKHEQFSEKYLRSTVIINPRKSIKSVDSNY